MDDGSLFLILLTLASLPLMCVGVWYVWTDQRNRLRSSPLGPSRVDRQLYWREAALGLSLVVTVLWVTLLLWGATEAAHLVWEWLD